jgi:hypothetical protein
VFTLRQIGCVRVAMNSVLQYCVCENLKTIFKYKNKVFFTQSTPQSVCSEGHVRFKFRYLETLRKCGNIVLLTQSSPQQLCSEGYINERV